MSTDFVTGEPAEAPLAPVDPSFLSDDTSLTPPSTDSGGREPARPTTFAEMNLHPDIQLALDDMGYFTPTDVQAAAFGPLLAGKDLLVQARTGTGKTTAFGLPILQGLDPSKKVVQAIILAPTRELALQVQRE